MGIFTNFVPFCLFFKQDKIVQNSNTKQRLVGEVSVLNSMLAMKYSLEQVACIFWVGVKDILLYVIQLEFYPSS